MVCLGKQTTIWLTYLLLNLKYICDSFHLSWRATLHMNIKLCSFLTLHKTCKGLRTGRRDWQGHFVHRHSISYCQTIDTTKWDFSSQQLPQQHTITFRFFKKEKIKNSCWKKPQKLKDSRIQFGYITEKNNNNKKKNINRFSGVLSGERSLMYMQKYLHNICQCASKAKSVYEYMNVKYDACWKRLWVFTKSILFE